MTIAAQPPLAAADAGELTVAVASLAIGGAERIVLDWAARVRTAWRVHACRGAARCRARMAGSVRAASDATRRSRRDRQADGDWRLDRKQSVAGLRLSPADERSPDTLGAAILRLLGDRALAAKLGGAARDRALRRFSMEQLALRYAALFVSLAPRADEELTA